MKKLTIRNSSSIVDLQQLYNHLFTKSMEMKVADAFKEAPAAQVCPECKAELHADNEMFSRYGVCDNCGHHFVWSAFKRVAHMADPGSFKYIGRHLQPVDFLRFIDEHPYTEKLFESQEKTGLDDAILTGRCRIGGIETVLGVMDFRFMGGSMGAVVGEQITAAFEYARRRLLPVVIVVNSGGARMQEGIISLMQMPKTAAAIQRFHTAGLLYISILASPTTGGVFASFGSLGDVTLAEPKALIGFAGPRVAEQATGQKLPAGSHHAETMLAAGQLDAIVARQDIPRVIATLLKSTEVRSRNHHVRHMLLSGTPPSSEKTAWDTVSITRHPDRPTTREYIHYLSPDFLELHGDHCYGDDPTVVTGLGEIAGRAVIFVGQQRLYRSSDTRSAETQVKPKSEGYRKAIRMMELATQLHCPLVTFIDTTGADPGVESEQHGIAWSLAHCLSTMCSLSVPTIAVIIGEGASGGAVAFAVADRVMMLQHAIYEVISPEGAATILYRDAQKAEEVASRLKLTASDCLQLGVIDAIIPEPSTGAHTNPLVAMEALQQLLSQTFTDLEHIPVKQLLTQRYRKFRRIGQLQLKLHPHSLTPFELNQKMVHLIKEQLTTAIASTRSTILSHGLKV